MDKLLAQDNKRRHRWTDHNGKRHGEVNGQRVKKNENKEQRTDHNGKRNGEVNGQRLKKSEKIGTWNICGLTNKEPEIAEFMTQRKISILGIADTRKKGTGTKEIDDNYVLIWSGVCKEKRAVHGVGFIIQHDKAKNLVNTEFISERLLKISIREGNKINHYIQVYAPCNDSYSDEDKDSFFEKLSDTINNIKEQDDLYVLGDFNGRVGVRRTPWTKHLGPHSDHRTPYNYNGNHVLELCAEHDLIITNTFYQHRETQIYTWYKWNNIDVSSQIDFTLARSRMRCNIRDL